MQRLSPAGSSLVEDIQSVELKGFGAGGARASIRHGALGCGAEGFRFSSLGSRVEPYKACPSCLTIHPHNGKELRACVGAAVRIPGLAT